MMLGVTMRSEHNAEQGLEVVQVLGYLLYLLMLFFFSWSFVSLQTKLRVNLPQKGTILDVPGSTGAC